jgi:hypothetical protein
MSTGSWCGSSRARTRCTRAAIPTPSCGPGACATGTGVQLTQGDPKDVAGQIPRADVAALLVNALGRKDADGMTFEILSDPHVTSVEWNSFSAQWKRDVR